MFSDDEIRAAYRLAYFLHPDNVVAYNVTLDGLDRFWQLRMQQERRPDSHKAFKITLPYNLLLQGGVYLASDEWERDQESGSPRKPYSYSPQRDDRIIRFLKLLIWEAMSRKSCNVALAMGCLLHTYDSTEVHDLAPDVFNENNLRRSKSRLVARIEDRFYNWQLVDASKRLRSRSPSPYERELISKSLRQLAPWLPDSAPHTAYQGNVLDSYFGYLSDRTEWEGNHVLVDPYCGGFPRLVREYNQSLPKESEGMELEEPDKKLEVPDFDGPNGSGSDDRFNSPTLGTNELISIRRSLEQNQRRRQAFRGNTLRARVDSVDYQFPTDAKQGSGLFLINAAASYIEVFGEDEDGEILLAAFYLRDTDWQCEDKKREMVMTNPTGDTVVCVVSPVRSSDRNVEQLAIQVSYSAPAREELSARASDTVALEPSTTQRQLSFQGKRLLAAVYDRGSFSRFLWRLAGASTWILNKKDFALERPKFTAVGMSVLCTFLLAMISMGYFLYLVCSSRIVATVGGVIWGFAITSMDRFILTTARKPESYSIRKLLTAAVPRVVLGGVVAFLIAVPLQIKVFEAEINRQLVDDNLAARKEAIEHADVMFGEIPQVESDIGRLEREIDDRNRQRDMLYQAVLDEGKGAGGSRRAGLGPVYALRLSRLRQAENELAAVRLANEPRLEQDRKRLDELTRQRASVIQNARMVETSATILARLTALRRLSETNSTVAVLSWLLVLIIGSMTTLPIVIQLLAKPGLYERFVEIMAKDTERRFANDFEAASAQEIEEKIEEVANLVRLGRAEWLRSQPRLQVWKRERH